MNLPCGSPPVQLRLVDAESFREASVDISGERPGESVAEAVHCAFLSKDEQAAGFSFDLVHADGRSLSAEDAVRCAVRGFPVFVIKRAPFSDGSAPSSESTLLQQRHPSQTAVAECAERKEIQTVLDITPTIHLLLDAGLEYSFEDALAELIDNSIQNRATHVPAAGTTSSSRPPLPQCQIDVCLSRDPDRVGHQQQVLRVRDNARGLTLEGCQEFARLGNSWENEEASGAMPFSMTQVPAAPATQSALVAAAHSGHAGGAARKPLSAFLTGRFSKYGVGAKKAIFNLGSDVVLTTKIASSALVTVLRMSRSDLKENFAERGWRATFTTRPLRPGESFEESFTQFDISHLRETYRLHYDAEALRRKLAHIYYYYIFPVSAAPGRPAPARLPTRADEDGDLSLKDVGHRQGGREEGPVPGQAHRRIGIGRDEDDEDESDGGGGSVGGGEDDDDDLRSDNTQQPPVRIRVDGIDVTRQHNDLHSLGLQAGQSRLEFDMRVTARIGKHGCDISGEHVVAKTSVVKAVVHYYPCIDGVETMPAGLAPGFEVFWNGRLLPKEHIAHLPFMQTATVKDKKKTLSRIHGALFLDGKFAVSSNKLYLLHSNQMAEALLSLSDRKLSSLFRKWIVECSQSLDSELSFGPLVAVDPAAAMMSQGAGNGSFSLCTSKLYYEYVVRLRTGMKIAVGSAAILRPSALGGAVAGGLILAVFVPANGERRLEDVADPLALGSQSAAAAAAGQQQMDGRVHVEVEGIGEVPLSLVDRVESAEVSSLEIVHAPSHILRIPSAETDPAMGESKYVVSVAALDADGNALTLPLLYGPSPTGSRRQQHGAGKGLCLSVQVFPSSSTDEPVFATLLEMENGKISLLPLMLQQACLGAGAVGRRIRLQATLAAASTDNRSVTSKEIVLSVVCGEPCRLVFLPPSSGRPPTGKGNGPPSSSSSVTSVSASAGCGYYYDEETHVLHFYEAAAATVPELSFLVIDRLGNASLVDPQTFVPECRFESDVLDTSENTCRMVAKKNVQTGGSGGSGGAAHIAKISGLKIAATTSAGELAPRRGYCSFGLGSLETVRLALVIHPALIGDVDSCANVLMECGSHSSVTGSNNNNNSNSNSSSSNLPIRCSCCDLLSLIRSLRFLPAVSDDGERRSRACSQQTVDARCLRAWMILSGITEVRVQSQDFYDPQQNVFLDVCLSLDQFCSLSDSLFLPYEAICFPAASADPSLPQPGRVQGLSAAVAVAVSFSLPHRGVVRSAVAAVKPSGQPLVRQRVFEVPASSLSDVRLLTAILSVQPLELDKGEEVGVLARIEWSGMPLLFATHTFLGCSWDASLTPISFLPSRYAEQPQQHLRSHHSLRRRRSPPRQHGHTQENEIDCENEIDTGREDVRQDYPRCGAEVRLPSIRKAADAGGLSGPWEIVLYLKRPPATVLTAEASKDAVSIATCTIPALGQQQQQTGQQKGQLPTQHKAEQKREPVAETAVVGIQLVCRSEGENEIPSCRVPVGATIPVLDSKNPFFCVRYVWRREPSERQSLLPPLQWRCRMLLDDAEARTDRHRSGRHAANGSKKRANQRKKKNVVPSTGEAAVRLAREVVCVQKEEGIEFRTSHCGRFALSVTCGSAAADTLSEEIFVDLVPGRAVAAAVVAGAVDGPVAPSGAGQEQAVGVLRVPLSAALSSVSTLGKQQLHRCRLYCRDQFCLCDQFGNMLWQEQADGYVWRASLLPPSAGGRGLPCPDLVMDKASGVGVPASWKLSFQEDAEASVECGVYPLQLDCTNGLCDGGACAVSKTVLVEVEDGAEVVARFLQESATTAAATAVAGEQTAAPRVGFQMFSKSGRLLRNDEIVELSIMARLDYYFQPAPPPTCSLDPDSQTHVLCEWSSEEFAGDDPSDSRCWLELDSPFTQAGRYVFSVISPACKAGPLASLEQVVVAGTPRKLCFVEKPVLVSTDDKTFLSAFSLAAYDQFDNVCLSVAPSSHSSTASFVVRILSCGWKWDVPSVPASDSGAHCIPSIDLVPLSLPPGKHLVECICHWRGPSAPAPAPALSLQTSTFFKLVGGKSLREKIGGLDLQAREIRSHLQAERQRAAACRDRKKRLLSEEEELVSRKEEIRSFGFGMDPADVEQRLQKEKEMLLAAYCRQPREARLGPLEPLVRSLAEEARAGAGAAAASATIGVVGLLGVVEDDSVNAVLSGHLKSLLCGVVLESSAHVEATRAKLRGARVPLLCLDLLATHPRGLDASAGYLLRLRPPGENAHPEGFVGFAANMVAVVDPALQAQMRQVFYSLLGETMVFDSLEHAMAFRRGVVRAKGTKCPLLLCLDGERIESTGILWGSSSTAAGSSSSTGTLLLPAAVEAYSFGQPPAKSTTQQMETLERVLHLMRGLSELELERAESAAEAEQVESELSSLQASIAELERKERLVQSEIDELHRLDAEVLASDSSAVETSAASMQGDASPVAAGAADLMEDVEAEPSRKRTRRRR